MYQVFDDLSWVKGKHRFRFGGAYIQTRDNRASGADENAGEALASSGELSAVAANLVEGQLYQFLSAVDPQGRYPCTHDSAGEYVVTSACLLQLPVGQPTFSRNNRYNDGNFYLQDAWKVMPRLTLNLGVRWEYYGVQHNANPALDSNFYFGTGANLFQQVRNGAVQIANQSPVGGLWAPDKNNWAPRVGFAYDLFGNGHMSLRGGYGIGYERNFGNVTFNLIQDPPNYAVISVINRVDVVRKPAHLHQQSGSLGEPAAPVGATRTWCPGLPASQPRACARCSKTFPPLTSSFGRPRLTIRYLKDSVLSFEYSGSKGTHEYDISDLNSAGYGSTFLGDARVNNRLNYQYSGINYRGANGFNGYNGLNVKFQSNNLFNKGLYLNANYTWSHATDNLSSTFTEGKRVRVGIPGSLQCQPGQRQCRLRHPQSLRIQRNVEHSMGKQFDEWSRLLDSWRMEFLAHPEHPRGTAVLH